MKKLSIISISIICLNIIVLTCLGDTYEPFQVCQEDIDAVLRKTISIPLKQNLNLPADITYACADIKYDDGCLKFCECGDGIYMSFRTAQVSLNNHVQDVVAPYWGIFWHYLAQFNLPIWLIEARGAPHAMAIEELEKLGGTYIQSLDCLRKNPLFQKCAIKKSSMDKKNLQNYQGIIVYRAKKERNREGTALKKFKKDYPQFIYVNDRSRDFVKRKDNTYKLFVDAQLADFIPQFSTYPTQYSQNLAQKIIDDCNTNMFIIKPAFSSLSNGVNAVDKDNLDQLLKTILQNKKSIPQKSHRSLSFWRKTNPRKLVAMEYVPSKKIYKDGKPYDPTMRVVFMMHHDNNILHLNVIAGFWKIPVKSLIDDVDLTKKHITIAHAGAYYSGILVDQEDWKNVESILHGILPPFYTTILKQSSMNTASL